VSRWVHRKAEKEPRCSLSWLLLQRREVPAWTPQAPTNFRLRPLSVRRAPTPEKSVAATQPKPRVAGRLPRRSSDENIKQPCELARFEAGATRGRCPGEGETNGQNRPSDAVESLRWLGWWIDPVDLVARHPDTCSGTTRGHTASTRAGRTRRPSPHRRPPDNAWNPCCTGFRLSACQLSWIVGRNPFDSSMLQGRGRNNADYSSDFPNLPGGIVNGITSG